MNSLLVGGLGTTELLLILVMVGLVGAFVLALVAVLLWASRRGR